MRIILPFLQIDPEFQKLIPPLTHEKYAQLEKSLIEEGCRDPIYVWQGFIVDGHNRYKICHEYKIEFRIVCLSLSSREDVISWICTNQLGKRNLSEETRRYLIGKKYEAEKAVGVMNAEGINQHTVDENDRKPHTSKTAIKLGHEFHLAHSTVNKYATYSKALDKLNIDMPDVVRKIKEGKIKISQDNLIALAKKPKSEIIRILDKSYSRQSSLNAPEKSDSLHIFTCDICGNQSGTVKDMPKFDPDSYVSCLSLTIPSWVSSIKRTADNSDLRNVSSKAKAKLIKELISLISMSIAVKNKLEE